KKRDPNAPKGPGNVFFLYCRMERDNIKDQVSTDNLGEVTRLLGQKWKGLSKEEKQVYYDLYNKELKEFEVAMEQY
ncbi:high mobility group box domain-containing protein, partial [Dichotomocladium elegans]